MAAPVLTLAEQKTALSKRKKKRILKNVLGLPEYLRVESRIPADSEAEKLINILERLLPSARLPVQQNFKCEKTTQTTSEEVALEETARLKRKQLSLGVNDLNKSIKKGLISAALLASDIEPKFLIHHLNLLCSHNKIPYLHLVKLREITQNCLGFPCIALGFKNNSDFSEAINEIKTISRGLKNIEDCEKSDTEEILNEEVTVAEDEVEEKNDELPFTYLYRSSIKERVFVPENYSSGKKTDDYIQLNKDEDNRPEKKDSTSNEDFYAPRKKPKCNLIVDKMRVKDKPRYHSVNLVKVSSNPNRVGKKKKS